MIKKILLGVFVVSIVAGSMLLYGVNAKDPNIITLGNQKNEIDSQLAIKHMDNVIGFEGSQWLKDGRILGVKDQARRGEGKNNSIPKICIYNPKDKSFEELTRTSENEYIGVGDISEDGKCIYYSVLLNRDIIKNRYDYYLLNIETKSVKKIVHNMTARSKVRDNKVFIAAGMKVYQWDMKENMVEVSLPEELINELSDFETFTFERYLDAYYKGEKIEGKRLQLIQKNYKADKENNAICMIAQLDNQLYLQSHTEKHFIYDIIKGTYRVENEGERERFFPHLGLAKSSNLSYPSENLRRECTDNGDEELWKVDDVGNKVKLIAKGNFITDDIQVSPDRSKLAYYLINLSNKAQQRSAYVYDFNKDKQIKIFPEIQGEPIWDDSSKQFFMSGVKRGEEKGEYYVTSVVSLND